MCVASHLFSCSYFSGDVGYGVQEQFETQGRTALRLANFLSSYLQQVDPNEGLGNLRAGKRLNIEQLFGEAMASVMGDYKIVATGIYFDRNKFSGMGDTELLVDDREYFGPTAFR